MNLNDPVSSIMAIDILTAGRDTPTRILREHFRETGIHHLPVVDDGGLLLGVLSHVDLFKAKSDDTPAQALVYETPAVIQPDDPIAVAVAVLAGGVFHALPVVDEEGGLCGLLTTSDLLRALLDDHGHELYATTAPGCADDPGPAGLDDAARLELYDALRVRLDALLAGETDQVAAMATVAAELHHAFTYYDWTGFYRLVSDDELLIGPYQGCHGCVRIAMPRGLCGAAASEGRAQLLDDVDTFPDHLHCSASTRSELAVPIITPDAQVLGVLDVASDSEAAFTEADRVSLEAICDDLGRRFAAQR